MKQRKWDLTPLTEHKKTIKYKFEGKLVQLSKLSSKSASPFGYPDKFDVIEGYAAILPTKGLYVENDSNWFRTSPIIKVIKFKTFYKIETANSFYKVKVLK